MNKNWILLLCVMIPGCETRKEPPVTPVPPTNHPEIPRLFRNRSQPVDPRFEKYPLAEAVPGKPGFVLSPYTGRAVDVTAIRSGGMAEDPSVPWAKRYFRVP